MHAHSGIIWTARRKARVEIIPLIDVIFFLLATFVLFTLSLNRIRSMPVALPYAGGETSPDVIKLQVTDANSVYWNGERIDAQEIPARLEVLKKLVAKPQLSISGDDRATFGPMVKVLDQVRHAGITAFSVETRTHATGK